jgi:hypothetical protein
MADLLSAVTADQAPTTLIVKGRLPHHTPTPDEEKLNRVEFESCSL